MGWCFNWGCHLNPCAAGILLCFLPSLFKGRIISFLELGSLRIASSTASTLLCSTPDALLLQIKAGGLVLFHQHKDYIVLVFLTEIGLYIMLVLT